MGRCWDLMFSGYDSEKLCAAAFRVKTTGDGFIASVGFPFCIPTESKYNFETEAVLLAQRFVSVWQDEMQKIDHKIHAGIGIARGDVQGYFPVAGPKQYDLWGSAIVLACRYEALRKMIEKQIPFCSSIIVLQEAIYRAMPPNLQEQFVVWDCETQSRVRDDGNARYAFYQFVQNAPSREMTFAKSDMPVSEFDRI